MKKHSFKILILSFVVLLAIALSVAITVSAVEPKVINNLTFDGTVGNADHILVGPKKISFEKENGVKFAHFEMSAEKPRDGERIDFGMGQRDTDYVVDIRLRVNEIAGGSAFYLLESKLSDSDWWLGYFLSEDGSIVQHPYRGNKVLTTYNKNEWFRLSFCFDVSQGTVDIYVNGVHKATDDAQKDSNGKIKLPELFRVTFDGTVDGTVSADIDWIRIYTGTELLSDEHFKEGAENLNFDVTVMDTNEKALEVLGDAIVVMTSNDSYFLGGQKLTYEGGSDAIEVNGRPMITAELLSKLLDAGVKYDAGSNKVTVNKKSYTLKEAAAEVDGTYYLPLTSIASQILKKELTYDARGCAIIDDKTYEVQEVHYTDRHIKFIDSDVIYRYMQFENASGEQMIADLKANLDDNQHPRILYTSSDIDYINKRIGEDKDWEKTYKYVISAANTASFKNYKKILLSFVDNPNDPQNTSSTNQQALAVEAQEDITKLARAYLISGDEKYAKKGVEILDALASWETVDLRKSNLAGGHWAAAFAIGYDSFYNYILAQENGEEHLKDLRDAAYNLLMVPFYKAYCGMSSEPYCITVQDNFTGVCSGGMLALLISMCDDGDHEEMIAYLMENTMKTLQITAVLLYPDGGYYESVGYSRYMTTNVTIALLGMKHSFGSYYGLDEVPGFAEYGYSLTFLQSTHTNVTYHDGSRVYVDYADVPPREIWAYLFDDPMQAALAKRQKELAGITYSLEELFRYEMATNGKESEITKEKIDAMGTDRYFFGAASGAFTNDMNASNPTFVGYHGGLTGLPHDMLDLGQFVFEANGIKWAYDMGSDDYNLPSYFAIPTGYQYYKKRPEGKNCIVINPSNQKDENGDTYYGQTVRSSAELILLDLNKKAGAFAAFDLADAYKRDVTSYVRGYYFGDNRSSLVVQDEITFKNADSELYWFMQLPDNTSITIDASGRKATLKNGTKTLVVEFKGTNLGNARFVAMDNEPIMFERKDGEAKSTQQKLAIHATGLEGDIVLSVKLNSKSDSKFEVTKISEWSVPGETVADPSILSVYPNPAVAVNFTSTDIDSADGVDSLRGCGSTVGAPALATLALAGATAVVTSKKRKKNK